MLRNKIMISINRIEIRNFRQYKDINLRFASKKGLYLLIGKNGMGKSNFLNAICWCLYGHQPFKFHHEDQSSKQLLNEEVASEDEWGKVEVIIEVTDEDKTISFQRSKIETQEEKFNVMIKHGEDWKIAGNPTVLVNSFLPESVSKFFLFDGEAVQNLYKGDYSKSLKDGIWRVSNVELLDRASEHLSRTRDEIRKNTSGDEPESEELENKLSVMEKQKIEAESLRTTNLENIVKLKEKREKLNAELMRFEKYSGLQSKKNMLESNIDDARNRLEEYHRQVNDLIITYAPFWYVKDALIEVASKLSQASSKGQLPPKIRGTFIKELLEKGECICGSNIGKDSTAHKRLMELLNNVEPLDSRSHLLEDKIEINLLIKELQSEVYVKMRSIREQKANERIKIEEHQLSLNEINEQFINAPEPQVGDIGLTVKRLDDEIEKNSRDIGQAEEKIKQMLQGIDEIKAKLNKLNRENSKKKFEQQKTEFLEEAKDKIDYVKQRLIDQIRKSVCLKTNEYFKELMWKTDEFVKVDFTEDYKVQAFKSGSKDNSIEIMSNGEMKVLSLATLKALAQLSGFSNMPVFIDSPLENLDKEVRGNFLNSLPNFITDKQMFIFSLDGDLIEEFGKKNVPKENFFKLSREKSSYSTSIKPYGE